MAAAELTQVRERIAAACRRAGRDPGSVELVVVSKDRPIEEIRQLYDVGVRDFGENRAQELYGKASELPSDIRWHFVGHLQRNKTRFVRPVTVLLHSLDSRRLAASWMKGPGQPPPVLIQVNVGGEEQKHGVAPEGTAPLLSSALSAGLDVRGLMTVAPLVEDPEEVRPVFAALADLRASLASALHPGLKELSMGMTDDFEVAVEEGSTMVRVGRAIFGEAPR